MQHSFDISIAEKYGVNEAIFLNNLAFCIKKNQANNKHFHDGRFWTYNSQEALSKLFPYWSRQNIRTLLKSLEKQDLVITGNYNEIGYDRTTWYSLTDFGLSLFTCFNDTKIPIGENQPIEKLKSTNSLVGTNQPIPDIKPDIKPDKRNATHIFKKPDKKMKREKEEIRKHEKIKRSPMPENIKSMFGIKNRLLLSTL